MPEENSKKPMEIGGRVISKEAFQVMEMVMEMTVEEQRDLLAYLKTRNRKAKRKNSRKTYFSPVHFSSSSLAYSGYITNMSFTGAYIEAPKNDLKRLEDNQSVILIFQHPDTEKNVKIEAKIVRIDEKGIGVRFMDPINVKSDYWAG